MQLTYSNTQIKYLVMLQQALDSSGIAYSAVTQGNGTVMINGVSPTDKPAVDLLVNSLTRTLKDFAVLRRAVDVDGMLGMNQTDLAAYVASKTSSLQPDAQAFLIKLVNLIKILYMTQYLT